MKNEVALRPSYWASVSGGKDSLFMLKLILEHLDEYPLDGVVHFELEIDFPFIKNVIDYMKKECEKHKIPFVCIKPRVSFYDYYEKWGFPSRKSRWCNSQYKLDAIKQLEEFMKTRGCYVVSYIGFCADETRRFKYNVGDRFNVKAIYPIAEYGIEEKYILEWAKNVPIFNDYYKYNRRCGCMFCPLQDMNATAYLMKYYPDKYTEFYELVTKHEANMCKKLGKECFSVFQSNPKYDMIYRDKIVREKYLPKLEEMRRVYNDK